MIRTNSQKMAQAAYKGVAEIGISGEFASFARGFPSLAHSSGLAQAIAFAMAKGAKCHQQYLEILVAVLGAGGFGHFRDAKGLEKAVRECAAAEYMRISRGAFIAADWIKRYAEATPSESEKTAKGKS